MSESRDTRLRRLKIRSWRRGTKEMDLILGNFFDDEGATLSSDDLDAYEALLNENDQDLYAWVTGQGAVPEIYSDLVLRIGTAISE